jgi:hypothetical protein
MALSVSYYTACRAALLICICTLHILYFDIAVQNGWHAMCTVQLTLYCSEMPCQQKNVQILFFNREKAFSFMLVVWGWKLSHNEDSSVTLKGTKVRTNEHSESCWLCYIACYVRASVCIVTGAIVWWFFTNISRGSLLWVKISFSESVHEMNVYKNRHVGSYSGCTSDGCLGREITVLESWDRLQDLLFCFFHFLLLALLMVQFFWDVTHYRMFRRIVMTTSSGLSILWTVLNVCHTLHFGRWCSINIVWPQIFYRILQNR